MPELVITDTKLGLTARWIGGATATLYEDASGAVVRRFAVGEGARDADVEAALQAAIDEERRRRDGRRSESIMPSDTRTSRWRH